MEVASRPFVSSRWCCSRASSVSTIREPGKRPRAENREARSILNSLPAAVSYIDRDFRFRPAGDAYSKRLNRLPFHRAFSLLLDLPATSNFRELTTPLVTSNPSVNDSAPAGRSIDNRTEEFARLPVSVMRWRSIVSVPLAIAAAITTRASGKCSRNFKHDLQNLGGRPNHRV
jgi:hypothetical protein